MKSLLQLITIIGLCLSLQTVSAQDDIRYSVQFKKLGGSSDFLDSDGIVYRGQNIGAYYSRRYHHSGIMVFGLEYNNIEYYNSPLNFTYGSIKNYAFSFGSYRYTPIDNLYLGIMFLLEWDSGDEELLALASQNGFGVDVSFGYDIGIGEDFYIAPSVGIRTKSIFDFKSREPNAEMDKFSSTMPTDLYIGLMAGYRIH